MAIHKNGCSRTWRTPPTNKHRAPRSAGPTKAANFSLAMESRYPVGPAVVSACKFLAVLTKAKECPQRCLPQRGIAPLLPRAGQLCGKQPTRKQHRSTR